jgi:hypothetical protein
MKTGRNDPCPCGSGKKFKNCCYGQEPENLSGGEGWDVLRELKGLVAGQEFTSPKDMQAFVDRHVNALNSAPRDDFEGLSSEQMHRFLHFPFESPDLVSFPLVLDAQPSGPVLTLFRLLADGIGEAGLKATATGNLPRNFCREAARSYWGDEAYEKHTRIAGINKETDFFDLHVTRLTATLAGLVRKYRGRFVLTRECRRLLDKHGLRGIYPPLFRAYIQKFNWAYRDWHQQISFIQHSFLFTLYLLSRRGGEWMPHVFYEDAFLRAFSRVLTEIEPESILSPEKVARSCYTWRALHGFVAFFGLAEVEPGSEDGYEREYRVRALPLLAETVRFHLKGRG